MNARRTQVFRNGLSYVLLSSFYVSSLTNFDSSVVIDQEISIDKIGSKDPPKALVLSILLNMLNMILARKTVKFASGLESTLGYSPTSHHGV